MTCAWDWTLTLVPQKHPGFDGTALKIALCSGLPNTNSSIWTLRIRKPEGTFWKDFWTRIILVKIFHFYSYHLKILFLAPNAQPGGTPVLNPNPWGLAVAVGEQGWTWGVHGPCSEVALVMPLSCPETAENTGGNAPRPFRSSFCGQSHMSACVPQLSP